VHVKHDAMGRECGQSHAITRGAKGQRNRPPSKRNQWQAPKLTLVQSCSLCFGGAYA